MLKITFEEVYSKICWIRNPLILDLDDILRTLTNNEKEFLIKCSFHYYSLLIFL